MVIWKPPSPCDRPDVLFGLTHFCAHRRGKAKPHRTEASARDERSRPRVVVVLRLEHLMLPDVGHRDGLTSGELTEIQDHLPGEQLFVAGAGDLFLGWPDDLALLRVFCPFLDALVPGRVRLAFEFGQNLPKHGREVSFDADVYRDVLVDFRLVDVDVDLLGALGVGLEIARDAIIESHAERQEQVGFLNRLVDGETAVHAHHAHAERVVLRDRAFAEQRQGDGDVGFFGELLELRHCARVQDPLPGENDRPLGLADHLDGFVDGGFGSLHGRLVAGQPYGVLWPLENAACVLHALGNVDEHRPRSPGAGDVECLLEGMREILDVRHQEVVLGDRQGDAGYIGLLESVGSDGGEWHLAGDGYDGRRSPSWRSRAR